MQERHQSAPNLAPIQRKYLARNPILRWANASFLRAVDTLLGSIRFNRLLDVGCGEGIVLSRVSTKGDGLAIGIDYDPERVRSALERIDASRLLVGDAHRLPFSDGSYDVVMSLEVLEHLSRPDLALHEMHRISSQYLLASVPNEPWWRIGNLLRLKYVRAWGNTPEHIQHWSSRGFASFIGDKFKVIQLTRPFLWTFVLAEKVT